MLSYITVAVRQAINMLREEVNNIGKFNTELRKSIDKCELMKNSLSASQKELDEIASNSGTTVDEISRAIAENEKLLQEIKDSIKGEVLNELFDVILKSDRDDDFAMGPNELEIAIVRMEFIAGMEFDEGLFRDWVSKNEPVSVPMLFEIGKRFLKDDTPDEENFFTIDISLL